MVREPRKASEYWHLDTKNDRSLSWFGGDPLGCLYHGNGRSIDALDGIIDGGNTALVGGTVQLLSLLVRKQQSSTHKADER